MVFEALLERSSLIFPASTGIFCIWIISKTHIFNPLLERTFSIMIGRTEEKKYLLSLLDEEESQFVAVFGRRRIGKTYLIRESFNYSFTFEHTGLSTAGQENSEDSGRQAQLDRFAVSLKEAGYIPASPLKTWEDAFDGLKEVIRKSDSRKKVIFIDELSWMDTNGSNLIPALESFWNGWVTARKEKDVILIVCASATWWITDKVLNSRGGLHNRLTGQIHLRPFTLGECRDYLESKNIRFSIHQILQCYMILGGIPYYWSLLKKGKSLAQNIDDLFFKEGAMLKSEYDNLYRALFNKPEQYIEVVEALSSVQSGMTRDELLKKTGISSSGCFSRKLDELENCGFIRSFIPFGYKSNLTVYQLMDNYTLFYFKFLKDRKYDDDNGWSSMASSPSVTAWSGFAFERVCLEHIPQIKKALGISGVATRVNSWSCRKDEEKGIYGSQIDLLIVRKDQVINICEMKYSESGFTVDAAFDRDQKRKAADFRKKTGSKAALHSTLITTYPVEETPYTGELQAVITAEDLFA